MDPPFLPESKVQIKIWNFKKSVIIKSVFFFFEERERSECVKVCVREREREREG